MAASDETVAALGNSGCLFDYFAVVSVERKREPTLGDRKTDFSFENAIQRAHDTDDKPPEWEPKVVDRYPMTEDVDAKDTIPAALPLFCLPQNETAIPLRDLSKKEPRGFSFVLTDDAGNRKYGSCLLRYVPEDPESPAGGAQAFAVPQVRRGESPCLRHTSLRGWTHGLTTCAIVPR